MKNSINREVEHLRSYADFDDIMQVFDSLNDRNTPDRPLLLEWNTWRAWEMLDDGQIEGNFARDFNGKPEETAGPGVPDILCQYKNFDLVVEVTMSTGKRQYNSEGEPVADHVGEHRRSSKKTTYGLFLAPVINRNVISYFFTIDRIDMASYGGRSQIVPMDFNMFETFIKNSKTSLIKPDSKKIKEFFDKSLGDIDTLNNELSWFDKLKSNVQNF